MGTSTRPRRSPFRVSLVILLAALLVHVHHDFMPMDAYLAPPSVNATVEQHFSENYYQARALFRHQAERAGAALHVLPLPHLAHLDLSIDVAVVAGQKDRVLVHISGTHGVEGFAGSAIQSAALAQAAQWAKEGGPTVLFVHALNAYGFAQLRRFNENNVDLNRNWLSPAEFETAAASDPNASGFVAMFDLLNPQPDAAWKSARFWPQAAVALASQGFSAVKRAAVSGNYHFPQGIFYGGREKQPSLVILERFLQSHVSLASLDSLVVLDIHTGLGKSGQDTLLIKGQNQDEMIATVFADELASNRVASLLATDTEVTSGYDNAMGFVATGIAGLLPVDFKGKVITASQEFGTVPGVFVLKAITEENAFYHHAPARRLPYGEKVRDVFYVHRSFSWKQSVLDRGLVVFDKLYSHLTTQ